MHLPSNVLLLLPVFTLTRPLVRQSGFEVLTIQVTDPVEFPKNLDPGGPGVARRVDHISITMPWWDVKSGHLVAVTAHAFMSSSITGDFAVDYTNDPNDT